MDPTYRVDQSRTITIASIMLFIGAFALLLGFFVVESRKARREQEAATEIEASVAAEPGAVVLSQAREAEANRPKRVTAIAPDGVRDPDLQAPRDEERELDRLRRENAELRRELDALKKAASAARMPPAQ